MAVCVPGEERRGSGAEVAQHTTNRRLWTGSVSYCPAGGTGLRTGIYLL